jgi:hypothetical protein
VIDSKLFPNIFNIPPGSLPKPALLDCPSARLLLDLDKGKLSKAGCNWSLLESGPRHLLVEVQD